MMMMMMKKTNQKREEDQHSLLIIKQGPQVFKGEGVGQNFRHLRVKKGYSARL